MPSVVFDASTIVGAALNAESVPARALRLARTHDRLCLSAEVEGEIREVREVSRREAGVRELLSPRVRPLLTVGILLVMAVLFIFLGDLKSAGIVALVIPLASIGTCRSSAAMQQNADL